MDRLHGSESQSGNELYSCLVDLFRAKHFDIVGLDEPETGTQAIVTGYDPEDLRKVVSIANSVVDGEPTYDLKIMDISARRSETALTVRAGEIIDQNWPGHLLGAAEIEEVVSALASTDFIDREPDNHLGNIEFGQG